MLQKRREICTFNKLKQAVEEMTRRWELYTLHIYIASLNFVYWIIATCMLVNVVLLFDCGLSLPLPLSPSLPLPPSLSLTQKI